jgi:hypothetical protein
MLLRNNFSYLTENTFLAHHRHQSVNVVMKEMFIVRIIKNTQILCERMQTL